MFLGKHDSKFIRGRCLKFSYNKTYSKKHTENMKNRKKPLLKHQLILTYIGKNVSKGLFYLPEIMQIFKLMENRKV